jgi:hypothetical protein
MRRLVLGLALCVLVAGCDKAEDGLETEVGAYSLFDPAAVNPSLCGSAAIPFPNNALFASAASPTGLTTDTTLNIPSAASTAVAANLTDGWSTTASAFTDVLGAIDFASAANSIYILEAGAGGNRMLTAGIDYTLQTSIAFGQLSGTGGAPASMPVCTVNSGAARFLPISQQRTRILIEPLKPLRPSTNYIVVVTRDLLSADGVPTTPNEFFPIVNSSTKLCRLSPGGTPEAGTEPVCADPATPALLATTVHPVLGTLTAPALNPNGDPNAPLTGATAAAFRLTTLETLRRNLVRPTVTSFQALAPTVSGPTVADEDIVIAWSFTTQSINASLATLNAIATAKTFTVGAFPNGGAGDLDGNGRLGTGELGLGLANSADIYVGTFNDVPYYLDDASGVNDFASQLGFWLNNGTVTSAGAGGFVPWTPLGDYDANPGTPNTPAPCTTGVPPFNWAAPTSTTNCHRIPLERSQEDLPVIITVPKTAKPGSGWPVVIFQHGITGNRTQMLPIGAALASAGMVTIAIDLPLHGLIGPASPTNPFYQAGNERTFDLDISAAAAGNACLSAPGGDGTTDPSGTCFINLGSLITSRDNLRQAVADLLHLSRSLGDAGLDFDTGGNDIDVANIRFAGISLGSIVGTTFLGVDTGASATVDGADERIIAASLSVPGGGLGKLLDASASFGPVIAAGLAGTAFSGAGTNGVGSPFEGTDTYETFVRFAQHLVDPGDPINYAVAANANHRIHMTMVVNDTVVPNSAVTTCPAPETLPAGIGATAADNTLAATRDAACDAGILLVGTNSTTQTACNGGVAVTTAALCPAVQANVGGASPVNVQDETLLTGFLSGTEPLYGEMGLAVVGPITPPGTAASNTSGHVVVEFAVGSHGSLLTPAGPGGATQFLAVTCEMQRQTATFLASNGATVQIGGTCP